MASGFTIGLGVVFIIVIIIIIVQLFVLWLIAPSDDEDPVCPQCPMRNCNMTGTPYFDPEFPYFFNGMECVNFSDAEPINFGYTNATSIDVIRIVPEDLSENNTCSNLESDNTLYFLDWSMRQDGAIYVANRIFITDGSFLSLYAGLKIRFESPQKSDGFQITLNDEPVGTSVVIPSVDFLYISVFLLADGSVAPISIQTFSLEDGSLNPINIQT